MPVTISKQHQRIAKFLKANHVGILATADKAGRPQAAAVYYALDNELNIYFITKKGTAKGRNLEVNPRVAFTVFTAATQSTLQISGIAHQLDDVSAFHRIFKAILSASRITSESPVPPVTRLDSGEYVAYKIKPRTMRLAHYTKPGRGDFKNIFTTTQD